MFRKGLATFVLACYFLPIWGCAQNTTFDAQLAYWRVLLGRGARENVIDSCNRLLHQAPSLPAAKKAAVLTLKASALRLDGQPDAALALHRQALRLRTRALGATHESVGNSYLNIGNCYLETGRNTEALQALDHSRRILERRFSRTDTNLIAVYTSLGEGHRLQRRYARAANFWNQAAQIARSHYPGHAAPVISATLNSAALHSETGRFDSALVLLQTARAALRTAGDTLQTRYIRVLNLQATAFARLGFPEQAIPLWKLALQLGDAAPDCPNWLRGEIRYNLGQAQLDIGDLFAAELNLQAALPFFAGEPFSRSRVWNGLGLAARYGGDPERAVACFTEALNANFEYGPEYAPPFENAGLFRNLAGCYLDQKQFQAAAYYAEKALAMLRKLPNTGADQAACMLNLARAAQQTGDYPAATQWLKQAQTRIPSNDVGLQFALHYQSAQLAMAAGHYPQSLDACRNALAVLRVAGPVLVNPFPYETVQAYAAMADCYRLMARQAGGQATWKTVLDCVRQAVAELEDLKGHFEAEHSLPEAQHTFSRLFDLGVEASLALSDPVEAWRWSERFKSNFQQQLAWRALHWSAPASLPEQVAAVQHARKRLAYFQQLRYRHTFRADPGLPGLLHLPAGLDDSIRYWAEQCRQLDRARAGADANGLLSMLKHREPDLTAVQQALQPGQTMLAYHWGQGQLVLFVLRRDTFLQRSLAVSDSLERQIATFFNLCRADPSWQTSRQFAEMASLGSGLYQALLVPVLPWLREELLIVPDGALCYLPFEALITRAGSQAHRFGSHRYLLHAYRTGYAHSAMAWLFLNRRQEAPGSGLLAVAPQFADNQWGLEALRYNKLEAENVHAFWKGKLLAAEQAGEQVFQAIAGNYRVLLLSTHSRMHHRRPEYSFAAFSQPASDSTGADNLLFVSEIYNLQLRAELVVLSACESASGKLYRGEGIVSLARAFQTAGARTVVASFWNVDDQQTPQLMAAFFRNLRTGASTFEALTNARRSYLAEAGGLKAHPFYWAGFAAFGSGNSVGAPGRQLPGGVLALTVLGVAGLVLAGMWWFRRRQI